MIPTNDPAWSELTGMIAGMLEELVSEEGFSFPIYSVAIDRQANLIATHYEIDPDGNLAPRFVAEHTPDPRGLSMPIILLFVDSATGKATYTAIEARKGADGEMTLGHAAPSKGPNPPGPKGRAEISGRMLGERMREYLHQLVYDQGFVFPMRLLAVGIDGSLLAGRYALDKQGQDAVFTQLANHLPQDGLVSPVSIAFFDANDRGGLMTIQGTHLTRIQ